jgi:hypothetical protein
LLIRSNQASVASEQKPQLQQPVSSRTAVSLLEERQRSIVRQLDSIHGYNDGMNGLEGNGLSASYESYQPNSTQSGAPIYQQVRISLIYHWTLRQLATTRVQPCHFALSQ